MPYDETIKFWPNEILRQFNNKEIKKSLAEKRLFKIINYSDDEEQVIEALEYLEKIGLDDEKIEWALKCLLRSPKETDFYRIEILVDKYFEKGKDNLKSYIDHVPTFLFNKNALLKFQGKILALVEERGKQIYPDWIRNAIKQGISNINSLFKERDTTKLIVENEYFIELFDKCLIETKEPELIPNLTNYAEVQLLRQGIEVKYDREFIKFIKN